MSLTTINIIINNTNPEPREQWFTMAETAKIINAKMGRTKMFRFLREEQILMDDNEPYQKYIDNGCFKMILKDVYGRGGQVLFQQPVTLVSPKGIDTIKKHIQKKEGNHVGTDGE